MILCGVSRTVVCYVLIIWNEIEMWSELWAWWLRERCFLINDTGGSEELIWVLPASLRASSPRAPEGTFSHRLQSTPEELVAGNEPMTFWSQGGGVLRISNDGMIEWGQKSKPRNNPLGFQQNPKKSLVQKLSPQKIPWQISKLQKVAKQVWLHFICRTTWPGDTWAPPQIFRLFWIPPKIPT